MNDPAKALLVAPFWGDPRHVGVYRVERFVRWLSAQDVKVVMMRAGRADRVRPVPYGAEITVRDPLELHGDVTDDAARAYEAPKRRPNRLRRTIAYMLFNPDPTVVWARRAMRHPLVLAHGQGASWVLASSPPESAHVASSALAARLGADLIVDMRDGWLDEPLKPILQRSRLRRWREGRLEKRILRQAKHIFVISPTCEAMLTKRLPFTRDKATILTNGYPPDWEQTHAGEIARDRPPPERLTLVHAGRFTGSSNKRKVSYLLGPLLRGIASVECKGEVILLGRLEPGDLAEVAHWQPQFEAAGWSVAVRPPVPREALPEILRQADGLLLLATARHVMTTKMFEYLPTGKPILCATLTGGDMWQVGERAPQMFRVDYSQTRDVAPVVRDFLNAGATGEYDYKVPPEFDEAQLSQTFLGTLAVPTHA